MNTAETERLQELCKILYPVPKDKEITDLMPPVKVGPIEVPNTLRMWRNTKNPFTVLMFHLCATQKGQNPERILKMRKKVLTEANWRQEFSMSTDENTEGNAIYPYFRKARNVVPEIKPDPQYPGIRGWDYGNTGAVVFAQRVNMQLRLMRELIMPKTCLTQNLAAEVIKISSREFPMITRWEDYCDPKSGVDKHPKSKESNIDILKGFGINVVPPKVKKVSYGLSLVSLLVERSFDNQPALIAAEKCRAIINGFVNGYIQDRDGEPYADGFYEHLMDCIRYIANHKYKIDELVAGIINDDKELAVTTPVPTSPEEAWANYLKFMKKHQIGDITRSV